MPFAKTYRARMLEEKRKLDRKLMPSKIEDSVIKLAETDDRVVMMCGDQAYLGKNPEYKQVHNGMTTRWVKITRW